ncbi:MAG TPA: DUF6165 family protein [Phenylobacterium sp.]|jgi:hypothetical protein
MPDAPISWGELVDKITILELKAERLGDAAALDNVRRELALLRALEPDPAGPLAGLRARLAAVNARLWEVEDRLREKETAADFGPEFVELARSVYLSNDERAAIKREINLALGSEIIEEKSYAPYGKPPAQS